jgi:hypothetical protein
MSKPSYTFRFLLIMTTAMPSWCFFVLALLIALLFINGFILYFSRIFIAIFSLRPLYDDQIKYINGNVVKIALTCCGKSRVEEALTMMKSAVLFSNVNCALYFIIFTDMEETLKERVRYYKDRIKCLSLSHAKNNRNSYFFN